MSSNTTAISTKINFDRFGLYFCGLIPLVLLGFWKSYFSNFFGDTNNLTGYTHFHASLMMSWVTLLIVQPMLIRRKKFKIHRFLGRFSYLLMPLILVSMLFLIHKAGNLRPVEERTFVNSLIPLMELFVFGGCYVVAILNRKNTAIHARAMVGTGLALLDPTLMRIFGPFFTLQPVPIGFLTAIAIILGVFIVLIIWERNQTIGRWIFPSLLGIYFTVYTLLIYQTNTNNSLDLSAFDSLMKWFYALPLT
jgi:uncharacterized membrane protein